jgi:glycosyltransferase involved in cell wall biosynthesis
VETPTDLRRVAVLRNQFLPYSETFIHDELRFHERYRATVLARREIDPERFPGHDVVAIESGSKRRPLASLWYGLSGRAAVFDAALARGDFALIHAHFGHNGAYALDFARRHHLPLVVTVHGHDVTVLLGREKYEPQWWFYLARYRRLFREAALILTASRELRDLLVTAGCPASKLSVHRLGVDIQSLERHRGGVLEPRRVTMVGRFVEKKGHEYGIRAIAELERAGLEIELVIIGDGPLRARYEQLVRELGLARVRFTGSLDHARTLSEIARSAALLAPSVVARNLDRESGMIVAKEASALGVPVIGTLHGGLPEIVVDGETGFLVEERDPRALAHRLSAVLCDPELRTRLGRAARAKMQVEYDLRSRVRALESHYDAVLARIRPR